jgi:aryl-alcohol dehydrogenase-like predicted oxidoreductase
LPEVLAANGREGFSVLSNQFSLAAEMVEPVWPGVLSSSDNAWRAWLAEHDPDVARVWHSPRNFERLERLAAERGVAPATLALAYVLHQPFPTFALIGPRTLAEARPTLAALGVVLDDDDVAFLVGDREAAGVGA